jgi:hypothetical protein
MHLPKKLMNPRTISIITPCRLLIEFGIDNGGVLVVGLLGVPVDVSISLLSCTGDDKA